ncbi:MAG: hypothetical protein JOZ54_04930 [Acidobacteria bacterium]|nr:hypothetical protein [Acidobacteriota bacterium]
MHSKTKSVFAAILLAVFLAIPVSAAQRNRDGNQGGRPDTFLAKVIKQVKKLLPSLPFDDDMGGPKP